MKATNQTPSESVCEIPGGSDPSSFPTKDSHHCIMRLQLLEETQGGRVFLASESWRSYTSQPLKIGEPVATHDISAKQSWNLNSGRSACRFRIQVPSPPRNNNVYTNKEPETWKLANSVTSKTQPECSPLVVSFALRQAYLPVWIADPDVLIWPTVGWVERSRPSGKGSKLWTLTLFQAVLGAGDRTEYKRDEILSTGSSLSHGQDG